MEKIINSALREKIKTYIKNGLDISDLIKGYSLKNEDLSRSIIKTLSCVETDISNCNFSHATIGSLDKITTIIRTKMVNCNFFSAKFIGAVWIRNCDARNCNFKRADVHSVDYQFTNFLGSSFCGAIITISTSSGVGCKFPKEMFEDLCKGWDMKINVEEI